MLSGELEFGDSEIIGLDRDAGNSLRRHLASGLRALPANVGRRCVDRAANPRGGVCPEGASVFTDGLLTRWAPAPPAPLAPGLLPCF